MIFLLFILGYVELCYDKHTPATFEALYGYFDEISEFLQENPSWKNKLFSAKERFIRSKERNIYSTDFFGMMEGSNQISFYYSTHFHEFISHQYPDVTVIPEITHFFGACQSIVKSYRDLFEESARLYGIETPPILLKVIKYLPSYYASKPHYDGTLFSLFLHSTDNESLLFSPYKSSYTVEDFLPAHREYPNSILLIPGTLLGDPTPHIVIQNGKTRYATVAFAMRPNSTPQKVEFSPLPNFPH